MEVEPPSKVTSRKWHVCLKLEPMFVKSPFLEMCLRGQRERKRRKPRHIILTEISPRRWQHYKDARCSLPKKSLFCYLLLLFRHQVMSDSLETPWTLAPQTPLSMGFPRLEYWKALVIQSCPILCDPMDYSPIGSSVHGILQARILE